MPLVAEGEERTIRCRFCGWMEADIPAWGCPSGEQATNLYGHVRLAHPAQYLQILRWLRALGLEEPLMSRHD